MEDHQHPLIRVAEALERIAHSMENIPAHLMQKHIENFLSGFPAPK